MLRKVFGPKRDEVRGEWRTRTFPTKYYSGDQIKKNEMGGACGTYGGEERCLHGFAGDT